MTKDIQWHHGAVSGAARASVTGGPGLTVWLTGLSGSGKSTIAFGVEEALIAKGRAAYVLDGDNLRHGLNADLGFSPEDRSENVRRVGQVALLMADAGVVVMVPLISPYVEDRESVRKKHEAAELRFIEIYVDAPLNVCEERDPKGLYARARSGEISDLTGVDAPYEAPETPELRLDTATSTLDASVGSVLEMLMPDM